MLRGALQAFFREGETILLTSTKRQITTSRSQSVPVQTKLCTHPLRQNIHTFHSNIRAPLKKSLENFSQMEDRRTRES